MKQSSRWWKISGQQFAKSQWHRLVMGCGLGCVVAISVHLLWHDSVFIPLLQKKWAALPAQTMFDGVSAYRLELQVLGVVAFAAIGVPIVGIIWRYLRAWWAGIVSLTTLVAAFITANLLVDSPFTMKSVASFSVLFAGLLALELWRWERSEHVSGISLAMPQLNIPTQYRNASSESGWLASTSDDPIEDWSQDIIGRTAIVESLVEHIFVHRTPIVALHGGLGDGKSSVLKLLRQSLGGRAIIVSFSTWLPGSDETLALDLFRDVATECRRRFYIPQLKRQAIAYARTLSGSVSYLGGLKELLPTQSQQQEIEELRTTLGRVPLPIVVLLDEIDRMQRDEIIVLLKILRGASSIPNVSFICAFSQEEIKKQLSSSGTIGYDYLEKFFPVSLALAPPEPDMISRLLRDRINKAARSAGWFIGTDEKTFAELLDRMWQDGLSEICTNLRKTGLLLNDLSSSGRIIGGEVNTMDLIGIEATRRFAPSAYQLIRKSSAFLTYSGNSWTKGRYVSDKRREKESREFFVELENQIAQSAAPDAIRSILSLLFPAFVQATKEGTSVYSMVRPTDENLADREKRICDSDYFPIYFRAAVPAEMFSEAELSSVVERLNNVTSEEAGDRTFKAVLDGIPPNHPKRSDFLWKLGRAVRVRLKSDVAEWLAYIAASHATDYAYDLVNIGEAARALNIVYESAQRFSESPKVQEILSGAMRRATDDTFALRLLEYTENKERNKVLTQFKYVDVQSLRAAFMERMRQRYGDGVDASSTDITKGDWWAFRKWADNSAEDQESEAEFWRKFIGTSRKRLAQSINVMYPRGYTWSEDPRNLIEKFLPVAELVKLLETANGQGEALTEGELDGISRFQELTKGKWFDITKPDWATGQPD
jgi:hypothetical protein